MAQRPHRVVDIRNRPALAADLLRDALHLPLPEYTEARIESAELTDIQPAEYRADLVVLLLDGHPVLGIVVEAQLGRDPHKRFAWPVYVAGLRARIRCPVCLLVVCADDSIARWCAEPIALGPGSTLQPIALGPAGVPIVTDPAQAKLDPELAVLSAMAHGGDADPERAVQRFGDVPAQARQRVEAATIEDLDLWTERVLSAQRIEDVLE